MPATWLQVCMAALAVVSLLSAGADAAISVLDPSISVDATVQKTMFMKISYKFTVPASTTAISIELPSFISSAPSFVSESEDHTIADAFLDNAPTPLAKTANTFSGSQQTEGVFHGDFSYMMEDACDYVSPLGTSEELKVVLCQGSMCMYNTYTFSLDFDPLSECSSAPADPSPSPSSSSSPSPTASATASTTPTASSSPSPSATATASASPLPPPSTSPTATPSSQHQPSPSPSSTPTPTASCTASSTPTPTSTPSPATVDTANGPDSLANDVPPPSDDGAGFEYWPIVATVLVIVSAGVIGLIIVSKRRQKKHREAQAKVRPDMAVEEVKVEDL